jgi:hypothetical protein
MTLSYATVPLELTNPVKCATSLVRVWGVMNYSVLQSAGMGLFT